MLKKNKENILVVSHGDYQDYLPIEGLSVRSIGYLCNNSIKHKQFTIFILEAEMLFTLMNHEKSDHSDFYINAFNNGAFFIIYANKNSANSMTDQQFFAEFNKILPNVIINNSESISADKQIIVDNSKIWKKMLSEKNNNVFTYCFDIVGNNTDGIHSITEVNAFDKKYYTGFAFKHNLSKGIIISADDIIGIFWNSEKNAFQRLIYSNDLSDVPMRPGKMSAILIGKLLENNYIYFNPTHDKYYWLYRTKNLDPSFFTKEEADIVLSQFHEDYKEPLARYERDVKKVKKDVQKIKKWYEDTFTKKETLTKEVQGLKSNPPKLSGDFRSVTWTETFSPGQMKALRFIAEKMKAGEKRVHGDRILENVDTNAATVYELFTNNRNDQKVLSQVYNTLLQHDNRGNYWLSSDADIL
ncbi:hypothetical protein ACFL57_05705 [Candidatus Margulisiibacteriota bacterium]